MSPLNVYCLPGNTTAELILRVVEQEKMSYVFTGRTVCFTVHSMCWREREIRCSSTIKSEVHEDIIFGFFIFYLDAWSNHA